MIINTGYFLNFIFGCAGSSLLCAGFLQLRQIGGILSQRAWGSLCSGFSCCREQALGAQASVAVACRLSSHSTRAQLLPGPSRSTMLLGMWDHPGLWLEPMSPTLAGEFLTTGPPGKSQHWIFVCYPGEKEKKTALILCIMLINIMLIILHFSDCVIHDPSQGPFLSFLY